MPSKFGQNLPWYFPFQPSYWQTYSPRKPSKPASSLPDSHPLRSAASEEYTAAVSIQGLSKVYAGRGEEKRALDKLSVDMYQGQITALLGVPSTLLTCSLLCWLPQHQGCQLMLRPSTQQVPRM